MSCLESALRGFESIGSHFWNDRVELQWWAIQWSRNSSKWFCHVELILVKAHEGFGLLKSENHGKRSTRKLNESSKSLCGWNMYTNRNKWWKNPL